MTAQPTDLTAVTEILVHWNDDRKDALDRLMPLVGDELRRRAGAYLGDERPGHTLQPTALVNEVYLRLLGRREADWRGRAHFLAFAALEMRRILVDNARAHQSAKRGGGLKQVTLAESVAAGMPRDVDLLALDQLLDELAALDPEQAKLIELRFFAGLSIQEAAEVVGVGEATVVRRWASARAWLYGRLRPR